MSISSISIIGLGLIGGSIAKSIKQSAKDISVSAYDRDEILDAALSEKVIDKKIASLEDAINSEIIFLCLPLKESLEAFKKLSIILTENNLITDVCGVKNIFYETLQTIPTKGFYVGGHPMTGKEKSGYANSDSLLFENSVYILTGEAKEYKEWDGFISLIEMLGARITFLNPKVHDIVVASVSHLPQLLAVSLTNSANLKESEINFFDYAAGGFRDTTRIASSDFAIWEPVISANSKYIIQAIDTFIYNLDETKRLIEKKDYDAIAKKFEAARVKRDELPKNTKGYLSPLYDIFIFVKDEPGVISKISTALFNAGINIKDIELLKIREGTGGTFRLAFENQSNVETAKHIIESLGFSTKL